MSEPVLAEHDTSDTNFGPARLLTLLKEVQEMKVFRYGVVALACGSMMFGFLGGGCLGGDWTQKVALDVAGNSAAGLFDVFVLEGVTRGSRVSNSIADGVAYDAACEADDAGVIPDGCATGLVTFDSYHGGR